MAKAKSHEGVLEPNTKPVQGLILFKIDGDEWTLDLRAETENGTISQGPPPEGFKPDLTLTISDDNFVKLVNGKLGPQQVRGYPSQPHAASIPRKVDIHLLNHLVVEYLIP